MGNRKVKWGVLSTAKIGREKVIPAMQKCTNAEIYAIASRDSEKAISVAGMLGIYRSYNDYESLILDPEIDAIYNPLPNHIHVKWTRAAMQHGKHVLCEKPLALQSDEIKDLMQIRDDTKLKVGEAFMVHTHPQWVKVRELINSGEIGDLCAIQAFFSYNNVDPGNIRNIYDFGGGGMWDIGCYPIHTSRFVLDEEPERVVSLIDRDPEMQTDRFGSVILDYPSCQCTFMVSTQLVAHQSMLFLGSKAKLEVEIPFNAPNDRPCRIYLEDGDLFQRNRKEITFDICDQYTVQGELFSEAILRDSSVPVSLENAFGNAKVLEAIFQSEKEQTWISIN